MCLACVGEAANRYIALFVSFSVFGLKRCWFVAERALTLEFTCLGLMGFPTFFFRSCGGMLCTCTMEASSRVIADLTQ